MSNCGEPPPNHDTKQPDGLSLGHRLNELISEFSLVFGLKGMLTKGNLDGRFLKRWRVGGGLLARSP